MSNFDREPIFWVNGRASNNKDRELVRFVDGRKIVERVPQRGHQGDYESPRPAKGIRYVVVVGDDGNVFACVLTCAAAHLDHNTDFGHYQQAKWRALGWYPADSCPIARLANRDMKRDHFRDQSLLEDRPCDPGSYNSRNRCKHSIAEEAARKAARAADAAELERKHLDPSEKIAEATRAQTEAIVKALLDSKAPKLEPKVAK